ncbi:MAG: hypothetical protein WC668_03650 [Patescibacteria group bacterium]|jgi:hypothetical protein
MNKSKVLIILLIIAMMSGLWLVMSAPKRLADKCLAGVRQEAIEQSLAIEQFQSEFGTVSSWYKPEYSVPISDLIELGRINLSQAEEDIKQADAAGKSKQKKAQAIEAEKFIKASQRALENANEQLAAIEKVTEDDRQELSQLQLGWEEKNRAYGSAKERLSSEGSQYLSKYAAQNLEELSEAKISLDKASGNLKKISDLLPVESSDQLGDPNQARDLLTATSLLVDSIDSFVSKVASNLDFYQEAQANAKDRLVSAQNSISSANSYLDNLVGKGPLLAAKALKQPYADLRQAEQLFAVATEASQAIIEGGKYDLPLVYSNALKAAELANEAIRGADQQLIMAEKVRNNIAILASNIATAQNGLNQARQLRAKLDLHAKTVWSPVADNVTLASDDLSWVRERLAKAQRIATEDQDYKLADSEITNGDRDLSQVNRFLLQFTKRVDDLESYRLDWPNQERRAERMIDDNEDSVESYGSHSSSAQSDFDSAKSHLAQARRDASDRRYESAVFNADQAYQLADDTGRKAKKAYDDYQDSQSTSSFSFDSDSSGSSSSSGWSDWGSSSSSSDSGGWGGSSSSSDSGGWGSSSSSSDSGGWGSSSSSSDSGGW